MNFESAQNYLYSLANIPRKEYMSDPAQCEVYLKRLQCFLDILGNPETQIPHYIHVTGTSGKGSTVNFLHSILQADGKTVGSTTSPHPTLVTERWKVGDDFMSKEEFVEIMTEMKRALDVYSRTSPYEVLPYFEMTAAIALYYFAKKNVAWAVLEVGCGGKYDATNVIPHKDVAVITNVGLDHTELLGNTKSEIAKRKAGIITGKTSVFTAETESAIRRIIETQAHATESTVTHSPLHDIKDIHVDLKGTTFVYDDVPYHTSAIGSHQTYNASLAIDIASSLDIDTTVIQNGIETATQPLRMEVVSEKPIIIVDGAHNPDKISSTISTISTIQQSNNGNIHLIVGFSGNKDLSTVIESLSTLQPVSIACTRNTINHFRKVAPPAELAHLWKQATPEACIEQFLDPADALAWTKKNAKQSDIILVTGSLFVASEIQALL